MVYPRETPVASVTKETKVVCLEMYINYLGGTKALQNKNRVACQKNNRIKYQYWKRQSLLLKYSFFYYTPERTIGDFEVRTTVS